MIFSLGDLKVATNSFAKENLIGKGGFGRVYKGNIRHSTVAVKVLNVDTRVYVSPTRKQNYVSLASQ